MIKIKILLFSCFAFMMAANMQAQCTTWTGPTTTTSYINLNGTTVCSDGVTCTESDAAFTTFGIYAGESYSFTAEAGFDYIFDMCSGVGAGAWVPAITILAPDGVTIDAFNGNAAVGGGADTFLSNCNLAWTASQTGVYTIIINEHGGGCPSTNAIDNGNPKVTCGTNTPSCTPPPAEDVCTGAAVITVASGAACIGTTDIDRSGATDSDSDPNTPAATCPSYSGGDVWWTFTSISSTQATVISGATSAASFFWYELYSGPDCANLTGFACSNTTGNDPSTFELDLGIIPAGDQIWIRGWDSFNDDPAAVMSLCAYLQPCILPDVSATIDCNGDIAIAIANEGEAVLSTAGGYTWDIDGTPVTMPTGGGTFSGYSITQSHNINITGSTNAACDGLISIAIPVGCELMSGCTDAMTDGGFESGTGGGTWTETVEDATPATYPVGTISGVLPISGVNGADMGGFATAAGIVLPITSSVSQSIIIPADATTLSFWASMFVCGGGAADVFTVSLGGVAQTPTGAGPMNGGAATCGDGVFYQYDIDVSALAGTTVVLEFSIVETLATAGTRVFVDNIILQDCPTGCPPTETFANTITETGTVDYEVSDNITSQATINSTAIIDYDAAVDIDLMPDFCVQLGAEFHAFIDGCGGAMLNDDSGTSARRSFTDRSNLINNINGIPSKGMKNAEGEMRSEKVFKSARNN